MQARTIQAAHPGAVGTITTQRSSFLSQPKAVWVVTFACVVSFMGLGLVDPILPAISTQLHATQATLMVAVIVYEAFLGSTIHWSPRR